MTDTAPQALAGRLPVLSGSRIYTHYSSLLLTYTAIAAASYSYLVGTALIGVGNTRIGIVGYLIGLVLGMAFVSIAGGAASFRYGVDSVDAAKAALGSRGAVILLFGVLACTLGWGNVLLAMTARGAARLLQAHETTVVCVALLILGTIWLLVRRGASWMERVANLCAGIQVLIAVTLIFALLHKFGIVKAWNTDVPRAQAYTTDPLLQLAYAVEFGVCNSLGMLPYIGGLARLVRQSGHLVGPPVLGYTFFGAFLIAVVGALATASTGQADPADWIVLVAGPQVGTVLFSIMLLANLGALVTQFYLAAISVQQIRAVAKLPWPAIVAVVLVPSVVAAFNTAWLIEHVMNWLAYNGVVFVGLGAVLFMDFVVLRRGRLAPIQLFATQPGHIYWFSGGVNLLAMLVIAATTVGYFLLFNPTTLRASGLFRIAGASIPALFGGCVAYYLLMRWLVVPTGAGGYRSKDSPPETIRVSL